MRALSEAWASPTVPSTPEGAQTVAKRARHPSHARNGAHVARFHREEYLA